MGYNAPGSLPEDMRMTISRRGFVGGISAALGYLRLGPGVDLWAQERTSGNQGATAPDAGASGPRARVSVEEYDGYAKLANNENPYGPPDSVMKAMTDAFKYANRYGYPDGGIVQELASHHGVKPENILLGAGSSEILDMVGTTFLEGGKKVVGVEPSYNSVYQHATGIKADAIKLPLLPDYRQDIPAMIKATRAHYRDVGFVYMCNPNNPTGVVVSKGEIKQLLDGLPEDMPVLIDEAYHHFVDDPGYATSVPYVLEGRPVIIARTFSKIAALAGMRLGYAVAPTELIARMRPYGIGSINAIVKWGGVAALKDTDSQAHVKKVTTELRKKTSGELASLGYDVIPSETNFFMVHIRRQVQPVIEEFRKRGVLVGRPFPPMLEHLRVSIGTADEMSRFMTAFKEIFPAGRISTAGS
jgi:histidinol-phosphate aminotransferase